MGRFFYVRARYEAGGAFFLLFCCMSWRAFRRFAWLGSCVGINIPRRLFVTRRHRLNTTAPSQFKLGQRRGARRLKFRHYCRKSRSYFRYAIGPNERNNAKCAISPGRPAPSSIGMGFASDVLWAVLAIGGSLGWGHIWPAYDRSLSVLMPHPH